MADLLPKPRFRITPNPSYQPSNALRDSTLAASLPSTAQRNNEKIRGWPGYEPTPLVSLPGLATRLGVGDIWYKDEGKRFGLKSFKALGAGCAVSGILARHGRATDPAQITVSCATDGNHGRAVAWAAHTFGCRSVVYVAGHVSTVREQAIAALGAQSVRWQGNHEETMEELVKQSKENGWFVVSETSNATEPEIAEDTIAGYYTLIEEIASQRDQPPTHIFVQAGVGGLAAAACIYIALNWSESPPTLVVVEAENADCVFQSIGAQHPVLVTGKLETVMAGLAAGEVSGYAWPILKRAAHSVMAVPDEAAISTMQLLANAPFGDRPIVGGESGVASLAAALLAAHKDTTRAALGLTTASRVAVIGTEGATDPEVYERIVGKHPDEVESAAVPD